MKQKVEEIVTRMIEGKKRELQKSREALEYANDHNYVDAQIVLAQMVTRTVAEIGQLEYDLRKFLEGVSK